MLQDRKLYCLQAHPCIFVPGNFTGWGSEGINITEIGVYSHFQWPEQPNVPINITEIGDYLVTTSRRPY